MGLKPFQATVAAMGSFMVVLLVLAVVFILLSRRSSKSNRRGRGRGDTRGPGGRGNTRAINAESVAEDMSRSFDPSLPHMSMDVIRAATNDFSPELIVGDGSFGMVYKAQLCDGRRVAVKKLDPDAFQGLREFRAEIETLGTLRHPNLARILGYCAKGSADRILVYEFEERGNLDEWLHGEDGGEESKSTWSQRMGVARGVAAGLAYLHGLPKPIIHRDIKASNVLLGSDMEARISDFGLARRVETSSQSQVWTQQVAGTMGYMPPEYRDGFPLATLKADIYSFGVLMLEIALARRPNLPVVSDVSLPQWVRQMLHSGRHMEMLDPALCPPLPSEADLLHYLDTALLCVADHPRDRPTMSRVVELLDHKPSSTTAPPALDH